MLIARRLILILIFTFVSYPTLRIILMLITCFIMTIHSAFANPYVSSFVNKCEIMSLSVLVILCLITSVVACGHETDSHLKGYLIYFPEIFSWTESLLVDIIPAAILLIITVVIALRLFLLLCILTFRGIVFLLLRCGGKK